MRVSSSSKSVLIKLLLPTLSPVTRVEQLTFTEDKVKYFYILYFTLKIGNSVTIFKLDHRRLSSVIRINLSNVQALGLYPKDSNATAALNSGDVNICDLQYKRYVSEQCEISNYLMKTHFGMEPYVSTVIIRLLINRQSIYLFSNFGSFGGNVTLLNARKISQ